METKTVASLKHELIQTYSTIIDIIRYGGDSGIVTNRRQQAYRTAIKVVREKEPVTNFYKELLAELTAKPAKVLKDIYKDGKTVLEDKKPYHGMTIQNGKVVPNSDYAKKYVEELESFGNLSHLTGIGIGIGDSSVQELIKMGYKNIDDLKKVYDENQFVDFRKGLNGPLCAYFEGSTREERMTREEASDWEVVLEAISEELKKKHKKLLHKMAGSYARKKKTIGDIDYLLTIESAEEMYDILNEMLDKVSEINKVGSDEVVVDSVEETPSKPKKDKRYASGIKLWFVRNDKKVKVEIYGYALPADQWCFPYFARSGNVTLQKRIKYHASKKGYKLGAWSLDKRGTDTPVWEFPDGRELIKKRLGKMGKEPKLTSIRDIFNFLEFEK